MEVTVIVLMNCSLFVVVLILNSLESCLAHAPTLIVHDIVGVSMFRVISSLWHSRCPRRLRIQTYRTQGWFIGTRLILCSSIVSFRQGMTQRDHPHHGNGGG